MRILLILLLTGCISTTPDAVLPPPQKIVHIDARALELCEPLFTISESASFEEILKTTIANFELYADCSNRQKNSVILLKQFSNKE